jgi:hypothetical protein
MTPNQWNVCHERLYKYGLLVLGLLFLMISWCFVKIIIINFENH